MIDLLPNDEQHELITATNAFLKGASTDDASFWVSCAKQGWFGLGLPESTGGVGYTVVEEALLFRELGRFLVGGPVLSTVLGARVAAGGGEIDLVHDIVGGSVRVGLGEVRPGEDDVRIWDNGAADLVLVVDANDDTVVLAESPEWARLESTPSIDPGYRLARLAKPPPGTVVTGGPAGEVRAYANVLVAAMLSGIAEATRDLGAQYAKDRVQFGKPIGTFQAVKHRVADTAVRAEGAWSQTAMAALRLAADGGGARFHAAAAKVVAAEAAIQNGRDTIQNHGAIGFTTEHDAHLYLKRAHVLEQMLGDTNTQLAVVLGADRQA